MILGIDFSIKSSAATIKTDNEYIFYTYARKGVIKEDVKIALQQSNVKIFESEEEFIKEKKASIKEREQTSMKDASLLIPTIINSIQDKKIIHWGLEGFSFASTGNRLSQISGYQWVLRWELLKRGLDINDFHIYSPMTVKSTAGKGNFKKENMIESFINSNDQLLIKNDFHKMLKDQPSLFQNKKGSWLKPIDDLIDSYWVTKTIENNIK